MKLELSHHQEKDNEWVNTKPLVFVLDQVQDPTVKVKGKKGKDRVVQITAKNFGSWMSITKLKTASDTLELAWRVRFLVSQMWVLYHFSMIM